MIIGFDAKRAFLNNSGLGNYSRTLISSLANYFPDNRYILYTPEIRKTAFAEFISKQNNCFIKQPKNFAGKKMGGIWRSFTLPRFFERDQLQIYHGLSNELPFTRSIKKVCKVVTIHDLIFIRYPELYPFIDRQIYKLKFKSACNDADMVFATSEQTKRDIVDFLKIPESKIKVVYQSCNPLFESAADAGLLKTVKQQFSLPASYLLYVGTIEARKNLLTIVKALPKVKDIPLVVVGKKRSYFNEISHYLQQHHLQQRVLFLENVSDSQLAAIYKQATLFIYPSIFEGFGIPIVEALWSKVPIITSVNSCFSEVGGPSSVYINPLDSDALADKINYLLHSEDVLEHMRVEGFKYVQQFQPKTISKQIMHLYQSLL